MPKINKPRNIQITTTINPLYKKIAEKLGVSYGELIATGAQAILKQRQELENFKKAPMV